MKKKNLESTILDHLYHDTGIDAIERVKLKRELLEVLYKL